MAFSRPTLSQIIDRIKGDFKSGLGLTTIIRRSFLDIIAKAFGGASHTLHGFIDWASRQLIPDTADDEYLLRWATIWGVERKEAVFAEINIEVTGTTGGTLTAGTIYQRSDGFQYTVDADVVVPASGTEQALIIASEAGEDGNIDDGSIVSLLAPIAGIETDATVDSTSVEGEAQETIDELRERLIERIQEPPSGGTASDYIQYAKEVAGVTRAWVLPGHLGEGTVGLTFVEDNESPIIPSAAKVQEVQDHVDPIKPITADLYVFAPNETQMSPTIKLDPNTAEVQAAVETELEDMLAREAQIRDAYESVGVQYDGIIQLSKINEAISIADGEDDHLLVSPTSDVQPQVGGLVTLGTITFETL
jgi:uncharacterized phage protein gp47/JayE